MISLNSKMIIHNIEQKYLKKQLPCIEVGDTIEIGVLIQEGNKERVQFSEGVIISMNKSNARTTITVRKIFQGIGIEKIYPIHSPRITNIKTLKKSKVRRAKLYYLRNKVGKATKLKQRF